MLKLFVIIAVLLGGNHAKAQETLPLNPAVTEETLASTICLPGWTATVRPPASYTNHIKKQRMHELELPLELIADFQLDHKISLSLGGAPSDPRNLVLQDEDEAHQKDVVEKCLPRAVCEGRVSLRAAQEAMWRDWRAARSLCRD